MLFVREVKKDDLEKLEILKSEILKILFEKMKPDFEDKCLSYDLINNWYVSEYQRSEHFSIKDYVGSLTWNDFPLMIRSSIKPFIQNDQQDGLCLNR